MTDGTKVCERCQKELPLSSFEVHSKNKAVRRICSPCHRATNRKSRSDNYETYLANLLSKSRNQAAKRGIEDYEITVEYLTSLWKEQGGRCAISGVILTHHNDGTGHKDFNASIDRIDGQLGYVPGNVQLVAFRANTLKQSLSTDMLYWWVKTIYEYSCD